jgi:catechol 2,3-dioxygenase-like lactoylglutathione lyase family enzyme
MPGTGIREMSVVIVPITDQDRSIDFYVNKLGLEKRTDTTFGDGYRWVVVYAPESATGIAISPPPPRDEVTPLHTGIALTSDDIDATHAEMRARGVDVDAEVSRMGGPAPPMFWFRDPDGHTLMVVESTES